MNQTMSSSSEWMHFYNQNFSGQPSQLPLTHHLPSSGPILGSGNDRVSDATVVTTTSTATPLGSGNSSPTNHLSPDGRVSKPARKRSRPPVEHPPRYSTRTLRISEPWCSNSREVLARPLDPFPSQAEQVSVSSRRRQTKLCEPSRRSDGPTGLSTSPTTTTGVRAATEPAAGTVPAVCAEQ
ncbi:hypothetical protein FNV43_RR13181 [Rhamnella rubrinervis]|uniref:Uncharacterized protein n=1 Tax=Rhamnella rubrinervis TaxID=2594499 RepID=A0A8K0MEZ5_9ROSA|nr:hypothetical protein FNV43_RR13181 [Rhamnella rubrinervis]